MSKMAKEKIPGKSASFSSPVVGSSIMYYYIRD
jgi:hypothetical protein